MNRALAENIRSCRVERCWTQEQLAEAARLNLRTIQRTEAAKGASAETVLAIAGALNVDVDLLRFDAMTFLARGLGVPREQVTPELLAEKTREMSAKYVTIPLARVESSALLRPVSDATAMLFDCKSHDDKVCDLAAQLQEELTDLGDIGGAIPATSRREFETHAFEIVQQLHQLGCVVSIALHHHRLKPTTGGDSMPWSTLYVVIAPENAAATFLLVEKNSRVRFA